MKNCLRPICCLLLVIVLMAIAPASALASTSAVISGSSVKVYSSASASKSVGTLKKGTKVKVKSVSGGIAKISLNGKTGYVKTKYLAAASSSKGSSKVSASGTSTKVSASGARVYKYASTSASSKSIGRGTKVKVVSTSGSWAKVTRNGATAWMRKSDLALYGGSASSSKTKSSKVERAIAAAKAKLGCAYELGSRGPTKYDCASLMCYAFRKAGVSLSGSAKSIGYHASTRLKYSQLKRGDIVCFNTEKDDSDLSDHVGIYLGSGKFLHASSAAGKVITSSMSGGYYRRVFSWGRRMAG